MFEFEWERCVVTVQEELNKGKLHIVRRYLKCRQISYNSIGYAVVTVLCPDCVKARQFYDTPTAAVVLTA